MQEVKKTEGVMCSLRKLTGPRDRQTETPRQREKERNTYAK